MLLTVLVILSSGTVWGFTGDVLVGQPLLDRNERSHYSYCSLAYTLEDPLKTALTTTAAVVSGPTSTTTEQGRPASPEQPAAEKAKVPPPSIYFKEFVPDIVGGTKRIFSRDNAPLVLIGVGLTGLALTVDQKVQDYFQKQKPMEHPANIGDTVGRGYFPFVFGIATIGAGEWAGNKKLADTGVTTLEALLVTGIATEVLKYATHRKRPNGDDYLSFPSGHASSTASWAASVSEMYDWDLRIAVPMYLVTAFVGASRIQANEHHLSDVIAGITLGTLVGVSFAKYHKEKDAKSSLQNISLSPVFDKDLRGCVITFKFL